MSSLDAWLEEGLAELDDDALMRELRPIEHGRNPVHIEYQGESLTLFSSNDYLGLSGHSTVTDAVQRAVENYGMGTRGSPLVCGYTSIHRQLEAALSELEGSEETLLFSSGFAANVAVMATLADEDCEIFSDALNHASIIDGTRLAKRRGAEITVFDHANPDALAARLGRSRAARKIVVTDGVFSMDGDLAPLDDYAKLKQEHDFVLVVDDAHSTLVLGSRGAGTHEHFGLADGVVDVKIGTLSKAFGTHGGFVSGSKALKQWLLNRGRPYVFSTALPVPVVAAALAVLEDAEVVEKARTRLWGHIRRVADALDQPGSSAIFPLVIGSATAALEASRNLLEAGIHVPAIRPPTVPQGSSRLRIALSAAHSDADIDFLLEQVLAMRLMRGT